MNSCCSKLAFSFLISERFEILGAAPPHFSLFSNIFLFVPSGKGAKAKKVLGGDFFKNKLPLPQFYSFVYFILSFPVGKTEGKEGNPQAIKN